MKKSMKVTFAASLMTAGMLGSISAEAVCTQTIYAERGFTNGATTQILGRTSSVATTRWFCNTTDPDFADMFNNAVSARNRVTLTCNAASCPAVGTTRFMGNAVAPGSSMFLSP